MINTCGGCKYGRPNAQDFNQLICFGAPPTAVLVPTGPGQAQIQFHRAMVARNEEACGAWKPKLFLAGNDELPKPMGQTDTSTDIAPGLQHSSAPADGVGEPST